MYLQKLHTRDIIIMKQNRAKLFNSYEKSGSMSLHSRIFSEIFLKS